MITINKKTFDLLFFISICLILGFLVVILYIDSFQDLERNNKNAELISELNITKEENNILKNKLNDIQKENEKINLELKSAIEQKMLAEKNFELVWKDLGDLIKYNK